MCELIAGGKSNLTYAVDVEGHRWILRRPPAGPVAPATHDMVREHRVMSALWSTVVPVPRMVALCEDSAVLGVPFYVMQRIDGAAYRTVDDLAVLGPARAERVSERLVDTLVALHSLVPADVGLLDLGRPEGFVPRQLSRWHRLIAGTPAGRLPAATRLYGSLAEHLPLTEPTPRILHGDYRLDNVLFDEQDRAAAVIDWEMATVGDPWTDLALLLAYQRLGDVDPDNVVAGASAALGFLSAGDLLARYVDGTGAPPPALDFYVGLAFYKLAAITLGVVDRQTTGHAPGTEPGSMDGLSELLLELGLETMSGAGRGLRH